MTVSGTKGEVSYGFQPGKIGELGTYDADAIQYYKTRASRVSFGVVQGQQIFPLEVGARPVPTGAYKDSVFNAGDLDLIPRLKGIFGILLMGSMGYVTSLLNQDARGNSAVGVNTHRFTFDPDDPYKIPWMSVRRMTPGQIQALNSGETGVDVRLMGMRWGIPAAGKLTCRPSFVGRDIKFDDATAWEYENTDYEDDQSTPDSGRGYFYVGGVRYSITGAEIVMGNSVTSPQQEMIVSSFRPDDFIVLSRATTIRLVNKYKNDDLCRLLYTNDTEGIDWSSIPYFTETAGQTKAFDAYFEAPGDIPGTSTPYGVRFFAERVSWAMEGPPVLTPGDIIQVSFVGTVMDPTSSSDDYFTVSLQNDNAGSIYVPEEPIVCGFATTLSYSGSSATQLDASATVTDAGLAGWEGGKIALMWQPPTSGALGTTDIFSLATGGGVTIASDVISISGTPVGVQSGGTYTSNYKITLYAGVSAANVQQLVRALRYRRSDGADSGTSFPIRLILQDSAENAISKDMVITHS